MDLTKLSKKLAAMVPKVIETEGINVPIYRVEETKTLLRFYLYGHRRPFIAKKPAARKRAARKQATSSPATDQTEAGPAETGPPPSQAPTASGTPRKRKASKGKVTSDE